MYGHVNSYELLFSILIYTGICIQYLKNIIRLTHYKMTLRPSLKFSIALLMILFDIPKSKRYKNNSVWNLILTAYIELLSTA